MSRSDGILDSSVTDTTLGSSMTSISSDLDSDLGISTASTTFFFDFVDCSSANLEFFFSIFGTTPYEIG